MNIEPACLILHSKRIEHTVPSEPLILAVHTILDERRKKKKKEKKRRMTIGGGATTCTCGVPGRAASPVPGPAPPGRPAGRHYSLVRS